MARFQKRKVFQILAGVLGVVFVISFAALSVVYITLPAVRAMVNDFVPIRLARTSTPIVYEEASRGPASPARPTPRPRPQASMAMLDYLLRRFGGGTDNEVRTCQLLANPAAVPATSMEWRAAFERFAKGEYRDDPVLESMLVPAGYFVRIPAVREALGTMRDALETGDTRFLDQPAFPGQLSAASSQFIRLQDVMSRLSGRAYHLMTLAKAAQLKPSLATDVRTTNFCTSIVNAARADMRGAAMQPLQDEKQNLLDYLAAAGIDPDELAFDPNLSHEISAITTERQVSLSTPWMTRMMGTPFYIVALSAMLPSSPARMQ